MSTSIQLEKLINDFEIDMFIYERIENKLLNFESFLKTLKMMQIHQEYIFLILFLLFLVFYIFLKILGYDKGEVSLYGILLSQQKYALEILHRV